jgi:hypothetical protein
MSDVTGMLERIKEGDRRAADELLPLVYCELRILAAARLAHEKPGQTLQATALVHEAYLRLVKGREPQHWDGRGHFFAVAAEAPRTAPAQLGGWLVNHDKPSEAEPMLRQCLAIRQKLEPNNWTTFNTRSQLGGALLGQGKYAEAEPFIVSGYEGLKSREATILPQGKRRLPEAADRVVKLYTAWGKPEKAVEWREKIKSQPPAVPKPR